MLIDEITLFAGENMYGENIVRLSDVIDVIYSPKIKITFKNIKQKEMMNLIGKIYKDQYNKKVIVTDITDAMIKEGRTVTLRYIKSGKIRIIPIKMFEKEYKE